MSEDNKKDAKSLNEPLPPRFHPPHPSALPRSREVAPVGPELLAAVAGRGETGTQLQQQAAELAEHLQRRQHQMAHRESMLNARSAVYDDQQRSARLWLRERQIELDNRAADIERQLNKQRELAAEEQRAEQLVRSVACEQEQLQQTRSELAEQREQLRVELETVEQQARWLEAARASWRDQCADERRTLDQLRGQLLDQRQATEELTARLRDQLVRNQHDARLANELALQQRQVDIQVAQTQEQRAALEEQRQVLARDREIWQARTAQQRQAIAAKWQRRRRELQQQRETLQGRQHSLRLQEDQLQQHREDLKRQQSELARRQLVIQHAQAVLGRQIGEDDFSHMEQAIRRNVDARLAAEQQNFDSRKCELHELAASLQQQQETLKIRHTRLQTQFMLRQRELDAQATRLEEREQEISRRECQLL